MTLSIYEKLNLAIETLEYYATLGCKHENYDVRMTDDGSIWCHDCKDLVQPDENPAQKTLEKIK